MSSEGLSKEISYALRHAPQKYGLELDKAGWVKLDDLICALRKNPQYSNLELKDIEKAIRDSDKKRHEIHEGKIRALYGHSVARKIDRAHERPPNILYHGTANRFISSILKTGLQPKGRQHVHLSEDIETAIVVGTRRDSQPVLLKVNSLQAYNDGVVFYYADDNIWLADCISEKYLEIIS